MAIYLKGERMNRRNLKARNIVKALVKYGCIIKRNTAHGVIIENTKNNKSTNIPISVSFDLPIR